MRGVNVIVVARRELLLHALAIKIEQPRRVRALPLASGQPFSPLKKVGNALL